MKNGKLIIQNPCIPKNYCENTFYLTHKKPNTHKTEYPPPQKKKKKKKKNIYDQRFEKAMDC